MTAEACLKWVQTHSEVLDKGCVSVENIESIRIHKRGELTVSHLNHLKKLNCIEISFNIISGPFPSLTAHHELVKLILPHNHIQEIPTCSGLKFLTLVDVSYNNIKQVSVSSFEGCHRLETLDLSSNRLCTLPDFSSLPSLRHLKVSHNQLENVDFKNLTNLKLLHLGHNKISKLSTIESDELMACNFAYNNLHEPPNLKIHHLLELQLCLEGNPINPNVLLKFYAENKILSISASEANATFMGTGFFRSWGKTQGDSKQKRTGTKRKMAPNYCSLMCARNGYEADAEEEIDDGGGCIIT